MAKESHAKPGVMLYFDDIRPMLHRISYEDLGKLITAVLDFSQHGTVTELDGMIALCFDIMRPKIERDGVAYENKRKHGLYMVYCREQENAGLAKLSESEWLKLQDSGSTLEATTGNNQLPTTFPSHPINIIAHFTAQYEETGLGSIL